MKGENEVLKTRKKGFTIVELVIVIAVIAILSAVLIPTFVNLSKKANLSADQQAVRQMNVVLAGNKYGTIEEAVEALSKAGYNALDTLTPVSTGHSFWWVEEYNSIVLLNDKSEVVFSTNEVVKEKFNEAYVSGKAFNLKRGLPKKEVESVEDFRKALEKGQSVTIKTDIHLSTKNIRINEGEDIILDLGGKTITVDKTGERSLYAIDNYGSLTIKNGTIKARGVENFGTMIIEEGVVIESLDKNGGAAIWNQEGLLTINGGTFKALNGTSVTIGSTPLINIGGKVIINGGSFEGNEFNYAIINKTYNGIENGTITVNNCTITAKRGVFSSNTGTVTINNGNFSYNGTNSGWGVACSGGTVTINNATFVNNSGRDLFADKTEDGQGTIVDNRK